jgi:hypothetical protein
MTTAQLIKQIGEPNVRQSDHLGYRYAPTNDSEDEIAVMIERGRFVGIRWRFYSD